MKVIKVIVPSSGNSGWQSGGNSGWSNGKFLIVYSEFACKAVNIKIVTRIECHDGILCLRNLLYLAPMSLSMNFLYLQAVRDGNQEACLHGHRAAAGQVVSFSHKYSLLRPETSVTFSFL